MSSEQTTPPPEAKPSSRKWLWCGIVVIGLIVCAGAVLLNRSGGRNASEGPPLSADDPVETTYQRIFDAYGGQTALERWKCGRLQYNVEVAFPGVPPMDGLLTDTFQLPGRMRRRGSLLVDGRPAQMVFAADGQRLWKRRADGTIESQPSQPYRDKYYPEFVKGYHPHSVLGEGHDFVVKGIEGGENGEMVIERASERGPVEIWVDVQTKLIRRTRGFVAVQFSTEPVEAQVEYFDYQTTAGGPVPGCVTIRQGGRKVGEMRFVSVEFYADIDPIMFDPSSPDR